jgi:uncharacterized protein (DUF2147 family)
LSQHGWVGLAWLAWLFFLATAKPVIAQSADPLVGRWLTEPRDGIIEITRSIGDSYVGRIIGGNAPHRLDRNNPDPARRQLRLLGQTILEGMRGDGAGNWSGGTIYDPDSGRIYKCRIELLDHDRLKVRGFLGLPLLGRSQVWSRYLGSTLELSSD